MSATPAPHHPRIVVGVDGSPISKVALRWAVDQARLTGATVDAVIAWQVPEAMHGNAWAAMLVEEPGFGVLAEKELTEAISEIAGEFVLRTLRARRAFVVGEGTVARDDLDRALHRDLLERAGHARAGAEHEGGEEHRGNDEPAAWPRPFQCGRRGFRVHCCRIAAPEAAATTASGILHGEVPKRS